jgi:hypothetical protein
MPITSRADVTLVGSSPSRHLLKYKGYQDEVYIHWISSWP